MSDDVEYKVDLDTRLASSKLRDLDKKKNRASTRARSQIWGKLRSKVSTVTGQVAGYASIGAITRLHSGHVDPWAAALKPTEAAVQQFIDNSLGGSVIAKQRAREQTRNALALTTGVTKSVTAARQYYDTALKITSQEEAGRLIVRQALQGPELDELIAQAVEGFTDLIGKSFSYIYDQIRG